MNLLKSDPFGFINEFQVEIFQQIVMAQSNAVLSPFKHFQFKTFEFFKLYIILICFFAFLFTHKRWRCRMPNECPPNLPAFRIEFYSHFYPAYPVFLIFPAELGFVGRRLDWSSLKGLHLSCKWIRWSERKKEIGDSSVIKICKQIAFHLFYNN